MSVTARELAGRFKLHRFGARYSGNCPICGYKNALSVSEEKGKLLLHCFNQCTREALWGLVTGESPAVAPRAPANPTADDRTDAALGLWQRAIGPHPMVETYLRSRGLPGAPEGAPLRLLPEAKHPSGARLPAMVALLVDVAGKPMAIHRTFLAPGGAGKAKVEPQRMTLGPTRGVAARLYPAAPRLVIAEGIETALSAAVLLRAPAWAAISAGNMADTLELPDLVREIIIAADNDGPGLAAAKKAAARFRATGRRVQMAVPDMAGADFNDLLRRRQGRG